jgi:hypothetical protein
MHGEALVSPSADWLSASRPRNPPAAGGISAAGRRQANRSGHVIKWKEDRG